MSENKNFIMIEETENVVLKLKSCDKFLRGMKCNFELEKSLSRGLVEFDKSFFCGCNFE